MQWLAVAVGGALGALGRYGLNALVYSCAGTRFPMGTLSVNILGSIAMGVFYVLIIERELLPNIWREVMMIGFLGGFTTFSAFSLDSLALWQNGHLALAVAYIVLSLVLCVAGTLAAILITRML